jgi:hypothetical protein
VVLVILGTVAIVGVVVAGGLWLDRRVSILPRKEELQEASRPKLPGGDHEPGSAPQTALRSDAEQRRRVLARQRCTCAGKPHLAVEAEEDARYGDRTLLVVRMRCGACEATRSLYFDPK